MANGDSASLFTIPFELPPHKRILRGNGNHPINIELPVWHLWTRLFRLRQETGELDCDGLRGGTHGFSLFRDKYMDYGCRWSYPDGTTVCIQR